MLLLLVLILLLPFLPLLSEVVIGHIQKLSLLVEVQLYHSIHRFAVFECLGYI